MRYLFLFSLFFNINGLAKNIVFSYDPTVVELSGVLELQTFPGPPNFESIKNGDDPERHFYLRLTSPIDVLPMTGKLVNPSDDIIEANIKIIQLSLDKDSLFPKLRKIGKGVRVKLKGKLFHKFSGHHHSKVLMLVTNADSSGY